jgi:hypothetical protein
MCLKDIENIINNKDENKGLNNLKINKNGCDKNVPIVDNCPKKKGFTDSEICGNCDNLYENLITGKITCKGLFNELKSRKPEEVKTQIKYNLAQLIQMRIKLMANKIGPAFGTFDWWKRYIWGANKIQNFIYFVSFLIGSIYIISFTFRFLLQINSFFWIIFILIFSIILFIIIAYYSFLDQISYTIPQNGDPRFIEENINKYNEKIKSNMNKPTNSAIILRYSIPIFYLTFALLSIVLTKFFFKNSQIGNLLIYLTLYVFSSIMISVNIFYTFLIPQFIIIGIILQKIISSNLNIGPNIAGISSFDFFKNLIIILVLLILSIYGSYQEATNKPIINIDDKCNKKEERSINDFSYQYWVILIIMVIIFSGKYFGFFENSKFMTERNGWGLFMEPLYYILNGLINEIMMK